MAGDEIEIKVTLVEKQATDALDKLGNKSKQFEGIAKAAFTSVGRAFDYFKGALTANIVMRAFDQLTGAVSAATQEFTGFSTAISKINAVLPEGEKVTAALTDELIRMSGQFNTSATDQAEGYFQIITAGFTDSAQAMGILTVANQAAVANMIPVGQAIDTITSLLDIYKGRGETASTVTDKITVSMRLGEKGFTEFSSALATLAPLANSMNISLDDLASTMAFLTSNEVKTENATMGLKAILSTFLEPSAQAVKNAKALGIEFDANAIKSKGFSGVLADVIQKTKGSQEKLAGLFGGMRELGPVLSVINSDFSQLTTILDRVKNSAGATETEFGKVAESSAFQLGALGRNLEGLALRFMVGLEAPLASGVKTLNKFITELFSVREVIKDIQIFFIQHGKTIRDYGTGLIIAATAMVAYREYVKLAEIAQKGFNVAMLASPAVQTAAKTVILGAAIGYVLNNLDKVTMLSKTFINMIANNWIEAFMMATESVITFKEALGMDTEALKTKLEALKASQDALLEETNAMQTQHDAKMQMEDEVMQKATERVMKEFELGTKEIENRTKLAAAALAAQIKDNIERNKVEDDQVKKNKDRTIENLTAEKLLETAFGQSYEDIQEQKKFAFENSKNAQYQYLVKYLGEAQAAQAYADALELFNEGKKEEALKSMKAKFYQASLVEQKQASAVQNSTLAQAFNKEYNYYQNYNDKLTAYEKQSSQEKMNNLKGTLSFVSGLTASHNQTLFRIGQAAAITMSIINTFEAASKALMAPPGPPWSFAYVAAVIAAGTAQTAMIAAQKPPPRAEFGGILPGSSITGDNMLVRANSGEMILTKRQQANLLNVASFGGGDSRADITALADAINSQPIILEIDGREIARAVRRAQQDGYSLAGA